jgi:hypothetical protein
MHFNVPMSLLRTLTNLGVEYSTQLLIAKHINK